MAELKYSTSTATGSEQSAEDQTDLDQEETTTQAEDTAGVDDDADPEGADALGDPGRKALQVMKEQRNTERRRARELQRQYDELKAQIEAKDKTPDEQALDQARAEARQEALEKANQRILRCIHAKPWHPLRNAFQLPNPGRCVLCVGGVTCSEETRLWWEAPKDLPDA